MEIFKNTVFASDGKTGKISMSGMSETQVGPPAQYGGSSDWLNPEELLVAAVNSCLMIVFFHFAQKSQVDLLSYTSEAEGKVEKTKNGLRFTNVDVVAKVSLGRADSAQKITEITQLTEKYCLVSNSLACPVQFNVEVNG